MRPGEITFTRKGASSLANVYAMQVMAPLTAANPDVPGMAVREAPPVKNVIEPSPLRLGTACLAQLKYPQDLVSKAFRSAFVRIVQTCGFGFACNAGFGGI